MTVFLNIILIIGNLLLFSGSVFGDLADNSIAWIIVIAAVAMDIYFIYKIAESISKDRELKRIDEATKNVNEIISRYSPTIVPVLEKAKILNVDSSLVNKEVVLCVSSFKNSFSALLQEGSKVNKRLISILSCDGYKTEIEKNSFLSSNLTEIKKLKAESDELYKEIAKHRIKLINEDGNLLLLVRTALSSLNSSKKCIIDGYELKEIINDKKPTDLEYFEYKYAPAILHINQVYYCLFSNMILAFDENGIFTTAIDPTALSITVERISADVLITNNTLPFHQYLDVDSKCISQGTTRRTWTHACRDGSPDLRYSYNPSIEYRTDKYEYGKVTLSILSSTITICLSSETAINALGRISKEYIKKSNNRHNPLPEFFDLLYSLSDDGEPNIAYILDANKNNAAASNYFCIIE